MMKTIIAATDFSEAANNATTYATDMAIALQADLLIMNAWQLPVSYDGMVTPVLADDLMKDAENSMEELKKRVVARAGDKIHINSKIIMGDFFDELKNLCNRVNPFIVVVGSQGTTAAQRAIFGHHAVKAMRNLEWSLIAVPPGVSFTPIKKIALACDLKNVQDTVPVNQLRTLIKEFNATLLVLNTAKEEAFDAQVVSQSGVLRAMIADLKPTYHFVANEDTDEGIMEFAESNHVDLLVVLPKRHSLIDKLIHKSHTKKIVLHSHVPVLALHE